MPVTNYYTLNRRLRGESTGGVRIAYGLDAIGSVTGTFSNGSLENQYIYFPYGTLSSKSGTSSDPSFGWMGSWGYKASGLSYATHYVRGRTYDAVSGSWTSRDREWPMQPAYSYVLGRPTVLSDSSGNATHQDKPFSKYDIKLSDSVICAFTYTCVGPPDLVCDRLNLKENSWTHYGCTTLLDKAMEKLHDLTLKYLEQESVHSITLEYCRACQATCEAKCCIDDPDDSYEDSQACDAGCAVFEAICVSHDISTINAEQLEAQTEELKEENEELIKIVGKTAKPGSRVVWSNSQ